MRILITGGAGFVGSSLAEYYRSDFPQAKITALDNLHRRGSELNLPKLGRLGVDFVHGDVRNSRDLDALDGCFDLLIEASAEPSVHAGMSGSPHYLLQTNLNGALNCLEFARARAPQFVFISTSRVYSIEPLRALPIREAATRFELAETETAGAGLRGISEEFETGLPRSLYGASKLAAEIFVQEYAAHFGVKAVINRCGVLAGPGQFGKSDQGVFTMWMARHFFEQPLRYLGWNGTGKQVRDLLHPRDLYRLIRLQTQDWKSSTGETFNIGGGREGSISLLELTQLCQEISGKEARIEADPKTPPVDVPIYISDFSRAQARWNWKPEIGLREIFAEIHEWISKNPEALMPIFGLAGLKGS